MPFKQPTKLQVQLKLIRKRKSQKTTKVITVYPENESLNKIPLRHFTQNHGCEPQGGPRGKVWGSLNSLRLFHWGPCLYKCPWQSTRKKLRHFSREKTDRLIDQHPQSQGASVAKNTKRIMLPVFQSDTEKQTPKEFGCFSYFTLSKKFRAWTEPTITNSKVQIQNISSSIPKNTVIPPPPTSQGLDDYTD